MINRDVRRNMIAKIKIGQKALGWSDDLYRDVLEQKYGVRSSVNLKPSELADLLDHMKAQGFKPQRNARAVGGGDLAAKIKALWLCIYNLGLAFDRSDEAMLAFVKRQTGKEALRWLTARECDKAIEGLKAWATRDGGVNWTEYANPRSCVIAAQWRRLATLGVLKVPNEAGLNAWLSVKVSPHKTGVTQLDNFQLDDSLVLLGKWLRKELEKRRDVVKVEG